MILHEDMSPQGRSAKVVYVMLKSRDKRITVERVMEIAGYRSREGVRQLMEKISAGGVPIYQPEPSVWALLEDSDFEGFDGRRTDIGAIEDLQ